MSNNYEKLKDFLGSGVRNDCLANWNGIEINIHPVLTLEETLVLVHEVVNSCFDGKTGEYLPEVRDFALRCSVLEKYADIDLPDDISEKHDLACRTDLYSFVIGKIDREQFGETIAAIDKKIDNLAQSKVTAVESKLRELTENINSVSEAFSQLFDGIDKETISSIANAFASGGFDESKLVDAFIEKQNNEH